MARTSKMFQAIGGQELVKGIRATLDGQPTDGLVRLILSPRLSLCRANRLAIFRQAVRDGGGFVAQWWLVDGEEAEVVSEFTSHRLQDVVEAVIADFCERPARVVAEPVAG